ncbi:MAG: hypothetical protein ABIG34_00980 [Candidatus Peregrinibacteria bacterium]
MSQGENLQAVVEEALSERRNPLTVNLAGDADGQKEAMRALLDRQPGLVITMQYARMLGMLHQLGLLNVDSLLLNKLRPNAIKESFSRKQLDLSVSPIFRCPTFLLVPPARFTEFVSAIDQNKLQGQNPTYLDDTMRNEPEGEMQQGWVPVILEGAQGAHVGSELSASPPSGENLGEFVERIRTARRETSEHLQGIDRRTYAMLMLTSMMRAKNPSELIDTKTSTILDAEPVLNLQKEVHKGIPIGKYWREGDQVRFSMYDTFGVGEDFPEGGHWMRHAVVGQAIQ